MQDTDIRDEELRTVSDPVWRILTGAAAFGAGVFVCGSVGSYLPSDPSWNAATGEPIDSVVTGALRDPLAAYNGDHGAEVFRACVACHTLTPDEALLYTLDEEAINELREEDEEGFEKAWQALNVLLQAKTVFAPGYDIGFEPKRRLVLSMFSNLKFIDGEIIPEWQEPFATIANANLTKQKSQELPEISGLNSKWLPE